MTNTNIHNSHNAHTEIIACTTRLLLYSIKFNRQCQIITSLVEAEGSYSPEQMQSALHRGIDYSAHLQATLRSISQLVTNQPNPAV